MSNKAVCRTVPTTTGHRISLNLTIQQVLFAGWGSNIVRMQYSLVQTHSWDWIRVQEAGRSRLRDQITRTGGKSVISPVLTPAQHQTSEAQLSSLARPLLTMVWRQPLTSGCTLYTVQESKTGQIALIWAAPSWVRAGGPEHKLVTGKIAASGRLALWWVTLCSTVSTTDHRIREINASLVREWKVDSGVWEINKALTI